MPVRKKSTLQRALQRFSSWPTLMLAIATLLLTSGTAVYHVFALPAEPPPPIALELDPNLGIEPYAREFLVANDAAGLIPIIACESHFKHFAPDGSVLLNKSGSSATGLAQILASQHPDPNVLQVYNRRHHTDLTPADFDITTITGNLGYALVLFKVRGGQAWECAH